MNLLIVNDDGIDAPGIVLLASLAREFGTVTVAAPDAQCSAMSQRITIFDPVPVRERKDFPVEDVRAFSIGGTPADCVKIGVRMMDQRPDVVFSGINRGYNTGFDIAYSGTIGACLEALMEGIPAIAFSNEDDSDYSLAAHALPGITRSLLTQPLPEGALWNVNFPACPVDECRGILTDRRPAHMQLYRDHYEETFDSSGTSILLPRGIRMSPADAPEGTDIAAVLSGHISIGVIRSALLG